MVRAQNAAEKVWQMESGGKRSFLGCGNQLKGTSGYSDAVTLSTSRGQIALRIDSQRLKTAAAHQAVCAQNPPPCGPRSPLLPRPRPRSRAHALGVPVVSPKIGGEAVFSFATSYPSFH